ncbi:hypothetical protein HHI36_004408 [Cryptolaemus montrouzieri]|uniref:Uncharacterized protein n=1 Tax=Cryptolaemus montrouzieri TaxID=559131 RepID=A0ABD2NRS8_9CUCU
MVLKLPHYKKLCVMGRINTEKFTIFSGDEGKQEKNRIVFMIHKKCRNGIVEFKKINGRISSLINQKRNRQCVINKCIRTRRGGKRKQNQFYYKLENEVKHVNRWRL